MTAAINNESLGMEVVTKNFQRVNFTVLSKDVKKGEIVM